MNQELLKELRLQLDRFYEEELSKVGLITK
jgi:hypothetical protein